MSARAERWGRRWSGLVLLAFASGGLAAAGCSLVVASDELQEGCPASEKACETPAGVLECVSRTSVEYGCGGDECRPCALPFAVSRCSNSGACAIATCEGSYENCDGEVANGCEVDLSRDEDNCGACGNACALANAANVCNRGTCSISLCHPGFADCDGSARNGCEVDVLSSARHCGGCNQPCEGICEEGECVGS